MTRCIDQKHTSVPTFESLEPRTLLSAAPGQDYDLSINVASVKLPPSIVEHAITTGTAKLAITRAGNSPMPPKSTVDVQVVLRPAIGPDVPIGNIANVSVSALTASRPKSVKVRLTVPDSIEGDTYSLVAIVDSTGKLAETNESNNQAIGPFNITAGPVCTDLSLVYAGDNFGDMVTAGDKGKGFVQIQNVGNTAIAGLMSIRFMASGSEGNGQAGSASVKVNLKPGATTKLLKVPLTIPTELPTTNGASYHLSSYIISPTSAVRDEWSNNAPGPYKTVTIAVPYQLTFRNEVREVGDGVMGVIFRTGTFSDNDGWGGTYRIISTPSSPNRVELALNYTYNYAVNYNYTFQSRVKTLGNKRLVFVEAAGSDGSMVGYFDGTTYYYRVFRA